MRSGIPAFTRRFWRTKPFVTGVAAVAILAMLLAGAQYVASTHGTHAQSTRLNWSSSGTASGTVAGKPNHPQQLSSFALSPQQRATLQARLNKHLSLPAPKPQHIAQVTASSVNRGPAISQPKPLTAPGGALADGDAVVEKNVSVAPGGICSGTGCGASDVQESSLAANGKYFMEVGNWFAATSSNSGASWTALNPYSINANFCCDQQVIYEPARNIFIWEMLDLDNSNSGSGNALQLEILNGDFSGGCLFTFTSDMFGMAANQMLDYPDIQFSTDDTYMTWNTYDPTGTTPENTGLVRMPTDSLASCSQSLSFQYLTRTDVFTFTLVSGSIESMNFTSQWCNTGCTSGSQIEFCNWVEANANYGCLVLNVNPFPFISDSNPQNCASTDGTVTNWCGLSDSRRGGAFLSRSGYRGYGAQVIGLAWSAAADPTHGFPHPYVVRNYFSVPDLVYHGSDNIWSPDYSIQYPNCSDTPYRGHVSCTYAYGGGDATSGDIYPSTGGLIEDKQHPTQPWFTYSLCVGNTNASTDRWGDFTTVREWSDHLHWVEGNWCNVNNTTLAQFAIVGEPRDHNAYLNWIGR